MLSKNVSPQEFKILDQYSMTGCGKVNFLISRIQKINNNMEKLAIIIKIRKYLSGKLSDVSSAKLLKET